MSRRLGSFWKRRSAAERQTGGSATEAAATRPPKRSAFGNRRLAFGLAVIGYLLSPLSWWNDAFINLPLAWLFASLISLISHRLFAPAMIVGYWLTNITGLLIMARGTAGVITGDSRWSRRRRLLLSLLAATGYTLLIVLLYLLGILKPLNAFLGR
jgi:hypothetical protein